MADDGSSMSTMSSTRPTWDRYWLGVAVSISSRADCTRRKVGAVLVDTDQRVIGTGYNGGPSGGPSCLAGECPRGLQTQEQLPSYVDGNHEYDLGPGACIAIHAEVNALLYSDVSKRRGATLYTTCEPCAGCWKVISNSGVARVAWPDPASMLLSVVPSAMSVAADTVVCTRRRTADGRWTGRGVMTMGFQKFGQGEILPEDEAEQKTAAKNYTDEDREALARENADDGGG